MVEKLGADPDDVVLTPFMVDTDFFDPDAVDVPRRSDDLHRPDSNDVTIRP